MWVVYTGYFILRRVNSRKICKDIKYYASQELKFIPADSEKGRHYGFPIATLGEEEKSVFVYFNHAETNEEAAELWYRRVKRINMDNIYVILFDRDGLTEEDIRQLPQIPCKNLIVLSHYRSFPDLPYLKQFKPCMRHKKKQGTPTMGGIIFVAGFFISFAAVLITDKLMGGQLLLTGSEKPSDVIYIKFFAYKKLLNFNNFVKICV